ncbi:MAG: hypothetical protein LBD12_04635 [Clostridiales Family XIII bacterium]|jgi:hypothetical protein|nr:hypothetical protein [Clostridiales Family XIII bacterium]
MKDMTSIAQPFILPACVFLLVALGYILLTPRRFRLAFLYEQRGIRAAAKRLAELAGRLSVNALMRKRRQERMDRELFDAISQIRNITAARAGADGGGQVSADMLLEQLADTDGLLAPAFRKALAYLRVNRREEMALAFAEEVGTETAQDFIRILIRWDEIHPEKLSSTLQSYQRAIKEMRTTRLKRSSETLSDLVFFPIVLNVLIVLINFLFVGYFIEQRALIQQLFF